jgi:hypothetical protein
MINLLIQHLRPELDVALFQGLIIVIPQFRGMDLGRGKRDAT